MMLFSYHLRAPLAALFIAITLLHIIPILSQAPPSKAPPFNPLNLFKIRPDLRRCVSPLCGGYFLESPSPNTTITCADGKSRLSCYVAELLDKSEIPISPAPSFGFNELNIVRGKIMPKSFPQFGNLGAFALEELFVPAGGSEAVSSGVVSTKELFVGLQFAGIFCFVNPCFNINEFVLGTTRKEVVSDVDLTMAGASAAEIEQGGKLVFGEGLVAIGVNVKMPKAGPAGDGVTFKASKFFLPKRLGDVSKPKTPVLRYN